MRRTRFTFADMIRSILMVSAVFVLFMSSVHLISNGLATPAVASSGGGEVGAVRKKSNGIGFVLMVSLQRAG